MRRDADGARWKLHTEGCGRRTLEKSGWFSHASRMKGWLFSVFCPYALKRRKLSAKSSHPAIMQRRG
jgi:hypothetical protein